MNPTAVMFVASGQGLMAIISPRIKAVNTGKVVFSSNVVRNSIGSQL
jgi:hypothetical protein